MASRTGRWPNWETISSLATGAGTLVLAVATFAAVRSSNRSARIAEIALQEQRRPLLAGSRLDIDPEQKIMFVDEHWVHVGGGHAAAENRRRGDLPGDEPAERRLGDRRMPGLGRARRAQADAPSTTFPRTSSDPQTRDLYIPAGDVGVWQGAIRERSDPDHDEVAARDLPARADHGRAPLLRPGRRAAHDHPVHAGADSPRRRRRGEPVRSAPAGTGIWIAQGRADPIEGSRRLRDHLPHDLARRPGLDQLVGLRRPTG